MGYLFFITWAVLAGLLTLIFSSFKRPSFSDAVSGLIIGSMTPLLISAILLYDMAKYEKEITRSSTYELVSLKLGDNQKYIVHYRLPDGTIKMGAVKYYRCTIRESDEESPHIIVIHGFRISGEQYWAAKNWIGPLLRVNWPFSPPDFMEIVVPTEKISKINL